MYAIEHWMNDPAARAAAASFGDGSAIVETAIAIQQIPAPTFDEARRGADVAERMSALHLADVRIDVIGNVYGRRAGRAGGPGLLIAAHLDTVFPAGTNLAVRHDGARIYGPGLGDNSMGVAALLHLAQALAQADVAHAGDIWFVANVGEEGLGDLRGMKYLFTKGPYRDRIKTFISVDGSGSGEDITHGAVGSKRYRVTFKGPGGHSYGAFGLVNPAYAMGSAIQKFSKLTVPVSPKTTFNVGVVGGGTSVNSIPFESWMEIDMRSESPAELQKLDAAFQSLVKQAVDEENAARSTREGRITADVKLVGDRPSGLTPRDSVLVQTAAAAVRAGGMTPRFGYSSTDSNIPISLGIPAITIDSGGRGDRAHALDEWIDVEKSSSLPGIRSALILLLTSAGLK